MKQQQEIQLSISSFKKLGWDDQQIKNLLEAFEIFSPGEIKRYISNLFHFFALLPSSTEDVKCQDSFKEADYNNFMTLLHTVSKGLDNN